MKRKILIIVIALFSAFGAFADKKADLSASNPAFTRKIDKNSLVAGDGYWIEDALLFPDDFAIRLTVDRLEYIDTKNNISISYKYRKSGNIITKLLTGTDIDGLYPCGKKLLGNNSLTVTKNDNKMTIKSGSETLKLESAIDPANPIGFWCKDKIGKSDFFLEITPDKIIYRDNDDEQTNCAEWAWDVYTYLDNSYNLNYRLLRQNKTISTEQGKRLLETSAFSFTRVDKNHLVMHSQKFGDIKFVTAERKNFVKNAAVVAGAVALTAAAYGGYKVYEHYDSGNASSNANKNNYQNYSNVNNKNLEQFNEPYIFYNKTHKDSLPNPKGDGPNGGALQSHHGLQQEWAKANLSKYGYDPKLAPTVTLETGKGLPHTIISNAQNRRRDARVAAGKGKWDTTIKEELYYIVSDFREAGFPDSEIEKVLEQQYKMFDTLGVPYERVKF